MLKTIFMGTPDFAAESLRALCEGYGPPELVVTQAPKAQGRGKKVLPTAVETLGRERGLPVLATENVNDPAVVARLAAHAPDLILVVAFGQLLKKEILEMPRLYCLNVHGSLLPRYRGAAPIQRAVWNGDPETGITIQKMVRKMDAGDMLLRRSLPLPPDATSGEMFERLAPLGGECLVEAVRLVESGKAEFTPQNPEEVTYAPKITKEEARIDWLRPARDIHNQVRALNPWPVAETLLAGERLRVHRTALVGERVPGEPGQVHTDHKSYLHVACGDGAGVALTVLQLENRKRLGVKEFLLAFRGHFPHRKMGTESDERD